MKTKTVFEAAETLAAAARITLADYKAEIRRNHRLTNRIGYLDFNKLPIVRNLERALQDFDESRAHEQAVIGRGGLRR